MNQLKEIFISREGHRDRHLTPGECQPTSARPIQVLVCLLLASMTLAVFWQVQQHAFIRYDDEVYVTENYHVLNGITRDSIMWAFSTDEAGFWHPLTWLSLMVDNELYGMNPGGYHWTNVLLHLGSTLLLFCVFQVMTGAVWRSFFVAALFAIHPLHVESVAWVAERKDVLSTFFFFLALLLYARYARRGGAVRYLLVLSGFFLGLMAKSMLVTLPFLLLLLDWWPLARFQSGVSLCRLLGEKVPFLFLSAVFSFVTYAAERQSGALPSLELLSAGQRAANACVAYVAYLGKMVWPLDLAVFYPHPGTWPLWQVIGASLFIAGITIAVVLSLRKHPYLFVGWFWYVGTLIPVIGLVQVGSHAMADRYTYIPLVGLFIMAAWGGFHIAKRWRHRSLILGTVASIILSVSMALAWIQVSTWKDSVTLFEHALAVTGRNATIHNVLGLALMDRGKMKEALYHEAKAVEIDPRNASAINGLGVVLSRVGRREEAIRQYGRALQIRPHYADALFNMGSALADEGRYSEALPYYFRALHVKPELVKAHNNIGVALASLGRMEEAMAHFRKALRINPGYAKARDNLAIAVNRKAAAEGHRKSVVGRE